MAITYIPYNPQTDVWNQLGSLAGGLMRENYDQRGAQKVLEYMQDQKDYLANQQAQLALQDWQNARQMWESSVSDEEKAKHAQAGMAARAKLESLGFKGLTGETSPEDVQKMSSFISGNIQQLSQKYKDPRYANMPMLGTVQGTGQPGRLFDINKIPQITPASPYQFGDYTFGQFKGSQYTPANPASNKIVW